MSGEIDIPGRGHFVLDDIIDAGFQRSLAGGWLAITTRDGKEHLINVDLRDAHDFNAYMTLKDRFPESFERRVM